MSATAKRTVSLPGEQAAFIDAQVASGDYASASEIVRAGQVWDALAARHAERVKDGQ